MKKTEARSWINKIQQSQSEEYRQLCAKKLVSATSHLAFRYTQNTAFRACIVDTPPLEVSRVSYPPTDIVQTSLGRCNRAGSAVFYCTPQPYVAILEVRPQKGDLVAVSQWDIKIPFAAKPIGYSNEELMIRDRGIPERIARRQAAYTPTFSYINNQFRKWFTCTSDEKYHLSSLISEEMMRENLSTPRTPDDHDRFAIMYPSICFDKIPNSIGPQDNFAFSTKAVDDGVLELSRVYMVHITNVIEQFSIIEYETVARSIGMQNGKIIWMQIKQGDKTLGYWNGGNLNSYSKLK